MKPKVFSMYLFLKPEIIHSLMTHNNNVEIFPLQQFSTHFFLPIQVHDSRNVSVFFLRILVFLLYWFTTINKLLFQNQFLLDLKFLLIPSLSFIAKIFESISTDSVFNAFPISQHDTITLLSK